MTRLALGLSGSVALLSFSPVAANAAGSLSGQGSTFVANFLEQCKADASKTGGPAVSYQSTGSGAGRNGYIEGTVDFAASDVPFNAEEAKKAAAKPFVYAPIVSGGIAVIYKVPGVNDLTLSGPTLAKIFTGKIVSWDDKQIAKENPGVKLPKLVMRVVVRSDSSGTSNVFSSYLGVVAKDIWKKGATSTFPIPAVVGIGQKGSDGVGNYLGGAQGKGAITYAEVSFATKRKLSVAKIINASGAAVLPTATAVGDAIANAKVGADNVVTVDPLTKSLPAYPIAAVSYFVFAQKSAKAPDLQAFAKTVYGECQGKAESLGYAPLPANVLTKATAAVASIGK
jgi:phosphate transport system substrate-binding protein